MILPLNHHIWFYPKVIDFRKQLNGLWYVIKNWEWLTRYLEDGNLLIDNNHTEREIKPFVIARKNFMFAQSQAGARAMALHFSLIRTAKLHRLDPYKYYVKIMKSILHCQTIEDYDCLLYTSPSPRD